MYPLDLAKKRLQIQGFAEHRRNYGTHFQCTGAISCFRATIKQEGILGKSVHIYFCNKVDVYNLIVMLYCHIFVESLFSFRFVLIHYNTLYNFFSSEIQFYSFQMQFS